MIRIHEYLLDFFMTLFALSSLALWGIILAGGSFSAYAVLALAAPLVSGYLVMVNGRRHIPAAPPEPVAERYGNRFRAEAVAIFVLLLFIFFLESSLIMILLLLIALFLLLRQKEVRPRPFTPPSAMEKSPFMLIAAVVIAVSYTLISHRPDPDDALYLFFGLLPLDQPHQAFNLLPIKFWYDEGWILSSYSTIEAVIAYWTGADFLKIYYLIVPALAAMLSVFAYHGLFQRVGAGSAGLLTLMTIIILILWGDAHRSPGNFTFVRLFHGKAIFYAVICPYLVSSAIGVFTRFPGSNLRLAMASISGIGLTQSTIVLFPLFFAGMILAGWEVYREPPKRARYLPFLVGLTVFLALGAGMVAYLGEIPIGITRDYGLREALDAAFYDSLRGPISIASFGLLPLLAHNATKHKAVIAVSAGLLLVALNPVTIFLVGQIAWSLTWRLQWLLLLAGAAAAGIFLTADFISRGKPSLRALLCAFGLIGFAMSGQTTFSSSNDNRIGIPQIKTPATIEGVFERNHRNHYKFRDHMEYRLENGRVCMTNGCY